MKLIQINLDRRNAVQSFRGAIPLLPPQREDISVKGGGHAMAPYGSDWHFRSRSRHFRRPEPAPRHDVLPQLQHTGTSRPAGRRYLSARRRDGRQPARTAAAVVRRSETTSGGHALEGAP